MDEELREYVAGQPGGEAERLEFTLAALRSVPDEEIPRRIAFVSDKVFEPKWWQRFPAWGLASAAMLSGAIVSHGYLASTPAPVMAVQAQVDVAHIEARFEQKLDTALRQARADNEARVREAVAATERRLDFEHRATMLTVRENFDLMRKQMNRFIVASADMGSSQ